MSRVICVDDETLILEMIVSLVREMPLVEEAKGFSKAGDALAWLKDNTADAALLDINMGDMNGIELAEEIKKMHPDMPVIFLTGHPQFAVDAFSVRASGYLLKPINKEKLYAELEYALAPQGAGSNAKQAKPKVQIHTFGNFEILVNGEALKFSRAKAKETLAFLVDRQGSGATRAEVAAALWETGTYDRPRQKQLDVIIRSMRDTLEEHGISDIVEIKAGFARIVPEKVDCDLFKYSNGDKEVISSYHGEYMNSYAWAMTTEAYLTDKLAGHLLDGE